MTYFNKSSPTEPAYKYWPHLGYNPEMTYFDIDDPALVIVDINNILVSAVQNGPQITVEILGGINTQQIGSGLCFMLPLYDIAGARVHGYDVCCQNIASRVHNPPGNGTKLWFGAGMSDSIVTPGSQAVAGGLHYRDAIGPMANARTGLVNFDATGFADGVCSEATITKLKWGKGAGASMLDTNWVQGANRYTGVGDSVQWSNNEMWRLLAFGRSTNIAGNATITVSSYMAAFICRSTQEPPTTGAI